MKQYQSTTNQHYLDMYKPSANTKDLIKAFTGNRTESYHNEYGAIKEYYIVSQIGEPEDYVDLFNDLRAARQTDIIKFYINCHGGNLFTTIQFLQAMRECDARIVACVEGACMSAATLIFLAADDWMISDYSMFLFHNYTGGCFGKGGEIYHGMLHERKWSKDLLSKEYANFLEDREIEDMLSDKDIWMDSSEVAARLELRAKKLKRAEKKEHSRKKAAPESDETAEE